MANLFADLIFWVSGYKISDLVINKLAILHIVWKNIIQSQNINTNYQNFSIYSTSKIIKNFYPSLALRPFSKNLNKKQDN